VRFIKRTLASSICSANSKVFQCLAHHEEHPLRGTARSMRNGRRYDQVIQNGLEASKVAVQRDIPMSCNTLSLSISSSARERVRCRHSAMVSVSWLQPCQRRARTVTISRLIVLITPSMFRALPQKSGTAGCFFITHAQT
jgi:hypothetical protein